MQTKEGVVRKMVSFVESLDNHLKSIGRDMTEGKGKRGDYHQALYTGTGFHA